MATPLSPPRTPSPPKDPRGQGIDSPLSPPRSTGVAKRQWLLTQDPQTGRVVSVTDSSGLCRYVDQLSLERAESPLVAQRQVHPADDTSSSPPVGKKELTKAQKAVQRLTDTMKEKSQQRQRRMYLRLQEEQLTPGSDAPLAEQLERLLEGQLPTLDSDLPALPLTTAHRSKVVCSETAPIQIPKPSKQPSQSKSGQSGSSGASVFSLSSSPSLPPSPSTPDVKKGKFFRRLTSSGEMKEAGEKKSNPVLGKQERRVLSMVDIYLHSGGPKTALRFIHHLNDDYDDSVFDPGVASFGSDSPTTISRSPSSPSGGSLRRSRKSSSSSTGSQGDISFITEQPPQLQGRSWLRQILSLSDNTSPLYRTINDSWSKQVDQLSAREQQRIQRHCEQLLNGCQVELKRDQEIFSLLKNYLSVYQTLAHTLFPGCAELLASPIDVSGKELTLNSPIWSEDIIDRLCKDKNFLGMNSQPVPQIQADTRQLFDAVEKALCSEIIGAEAIIAMDYAQASEKYQSAYKQIATFRDALTNIETSSFDAKANIVSAFWEDLLALEQRLLEHTRALGAFLSSDFRHPDNWQHCLGIIAQTAKKYAVEHYQGSRRAEADEIIDQWQARHPYGREGQPDRPFFSRDLLACEQELLALLKCDRSKFDLYRTEVLKAQPARIRSKTLQFLFDDNFHEVTVEQRPAAHVYLGDTEEDRVYDVAQFNGHNHPSCYRTAPRGLNLQVTQVTVDDKPVLQEVRTGIPFAYPVKKDQRAKVTDQRWRDILTLCGATFFPQQMLEGFQSENKKDSGQQTTPFTMPVFYICLLSPDNLRPHFCAFENVDNERKWCAKLQEKVNELNSLPLQLVVRKSSGPTGTVLVQPRILMFVCPANQLGFSPKLAFTKTWDNADLYNQQAFLQLFGTLSPDSPLTRESMAGAYLADHPDLDPVIRKEIEEICYLLRYMFTNKLHRTLGEEPFLFPNYVSELGRLLGVANVSGCKSAKDRTGNYERCNIEMATRLALLRKKLREALIQLRQQDNPEAVALQSQQLIPPIDRHLTTDDFYNNAQLLICSNQLEITIDCLSKPGIKTPPYMLGQVKALFPAINGYLKLEKHKRKQTASSTPPSPKRVTGSWQGATAGFLPEPPSQGREPSAGNTI